LLTGSNSTALNSCIHDLYTQFAQFALKTLGLVNYFLGFKAYRDGFGLYLTHIKYVVDLLKKAAMLSCKPCNTPMATGVSLTDEGDSFPIPCIEH